MVLVVFDSIQPSWSLVLGANGTVLYNFVQYFLKIRLVTTHQKIS